MSTFSGHPSRPAATPPRRSLALLLARHRRALGTLCAAIALTGTVLLVRPPPQPTVAVLTAARDLSARTPVAGRDIAVRHLPPSAVPAGALRPGAEPVGRRLTAPVRHGEVLTNVRVADPPAAAYGPDMVAAPVRVAERGVLAVLRPGSRVDVLAAARPPPAGGLAPGAADPAPAETVVRDRPVIAVPGEKDAGSGSAPAAGPAPGNAGGGTGAVVLLAVTPEEARVLAGHATVGQLSVTIRS